MPKFSWGATRFVILVGNVAIKITRIRMSWIVRRFFLHLKNGELRERLRYQVENPKLATDNILAGIRANRIERGLWRPSLSPYLVPTFFSLGSIINVQGRGKEVSSEELSAAHPFRALLACLPIESVADMGNPENFCRYKGEVRLADYGSEAALKLFSRSPVVAKVRVA